MSQNLDMKTILMLFFSTLTLPAFSQISINISNPAPLQLSDSTLHVQVQVTSVNELTSVTVAIDSLQAPLIYDSNTGFIEGMVPLAGFREGDTLTLKVTAIDYLNNKQYDSVRFIYVNPLFVTFIEPQDNFVANPLLHYNLKVSDFDSCKIDFYETPGAGQPRGSLLYSGTIKDSATGDIDLTGLTNQSIEIVVTDKVGQTVSQVFKTILMSTKTNPLLSLVYRGSKTILNLNEKKVLAEDATAQHPGIIDISNGSETAIPFSSPITSGYVTPYGAVFESHGFYNWRGGQVDFVGYGQNLKSKGDFAAWIADDDAHEYYVVKLMNVKTESTVKIRSYGAIYYYDLASNGRVAYSQSHNSVYLYSVSTGGIGSQIGHGTDVATDGKSVVYRDGTLVYLYNGDTTSLVTDINGIHVSGNVFAINNGLVAYCKVGQFGESQVWLRDNAGNNTQVSHLGGNTFIENINALGDVMLANGDKRYLATKGGSVKEVSPNLGTTYYFDSTWYITIGNTVFKVNNTIGPIKNIKVGNWSDPSVWSNNRVPDDITAVELDYDVTIDANAQCKSLKTNNHTIHVNQNMTLDITGK